MIDPKQSLLQAMLREDLLSFTAKCFATLNPSQVLTRQWYLEAIAWKLELVRRGIIKRLIIAVPPRHLKSIMASVAFPAWLLGRDPSLRIVCASYAADLADKFALDSRAILTSHWYREAFPSTRISREKNAVSDFMTTARGGRLTTSVGGSLTGRGGDILIFDDPMKPADALSTAKRQSACDWFDNTAYSRLDDKQNGAIIVVMQRVHQEDLVGHLLGKGDDWDMLTLPSIAEVDETIAIGPGRYHHRRAGELLQPQREPLHVLEALKRTIGHYNFSAQYQQAPIPIEGEIIKWGWFRRYDTAPQRKGHAQVVQSWDTASKGGELNDYSVCTTWLAKGQDYYLLDVFRKKLLYPELRRAVIEQSERWQPSAILIEDKASGTALSQDFRPGELKGCYKPIPIDPESDKLTRAAAQSLAIENGQVFLPAEAPWLADLHAEIVQFPNARHDDQIDSMSQYLGWIRKRSFGGITRVKLSGI